MMPRVPHFKPGDAPRWRSGQQGLTLVEIMVALTIGLILIAGVAQIFLGARQSYRFQDALSRVQENGRYAADLISRDARMAGYAGCTTLASVVPNIVVPPPPAVVYARDSYVFGQESVPAANAFAAIAGTDTITLRMLQPDAVPVAADMVAPNDRIAIDANPAGFAVGEILAVADCNDVDIFVSTAIAGGGPLEVLANAGLQKAYTEGALLTRFREVSYFIRPGASGEPALWRRDFAGDMELIEGVEDLWIRYGIDLNNNGVPDTYLAAAAVGDWGQVRSIRMSLLLRSTEDNITGLAQPVDFRGAVLPAGDRRLRQVITTTVGIRNRLP